MTRPQGTVRLGLAGDTMLGRKVGEAMRHRPPESLVADEVVAVLAEADLVILNLECCISDRGTPWPDPGKPFFFRAPPEAVRLLIHLGVDCVTLANNHALDFGVEALTDTLDILGDFGIAVAGAGRDVGEARRPATLRAGGLRFDVVGLTDHPADYAAGPDTPGVAYADLHTGLPAWIADAVRSSAADGVVVSPHWGPNMTREPVPHVRRSAVDLLGAGASLIAGHSAHMFHGVGPGVVYDLGDFLDDYAVHPDLRNDLGLMFLVDLGPAGPTRLEAVPLSLDFCHTRLADPDQAEWIAERFVAACAALGTEAGVEDGRLVVDLAGAPTPEGRALG